MLLRGVGADTDRSTYRESVTYEPGDRVEYIAAPVFDLIIETGEVGIVTKVEDGWVFAEWPRSGVHGVPAAHVRAVPAAE